jgi:F-type H+-transporting ATPase subunit beta
LEEVEMSATVEEMTQRVMEDGRVVAVTGPVVDVEFPPASIPDIFEPLRMDVEVDGKNVVIMLEVARQIGEGRVRCIALKPTDGLRRGTVVKRTGAGIKVPAYTSSKNSQKCSLH